VTFPIDNSVHRSSVVTAVTRSPYIMACVKSNLPISTNIYDIKDRTNAIARSYRACTQLVGFDRTDSIRTEFYFAHSVGVLDLFRY